MLSQKEKAIYITMWIFFSVQRLVECVLSMVKEGTVTFSGAINAGTPAF
jgi:hypothetical protein